MFKITQSYEDFNGNQRKEDLYFNFTEQQLRRFLENEPSFNEKNLAEIMETRDPSRMLDAIEKLLVAAYGKKSEDGKSFIKNKEITENFEGSAAFAQLMDDLMYNGNEKMIEEFLINIFPKKFSESIRSELAKPKAEIIDAPVNTAE